MLFDKQVTDQKWQMRVSLIIFIVVFGETWEIYVDYIDNGLESGPNVKIEWSVIYREKLNIRNMFEASIKKLVNDYMIDNGLDSWRYEKIEWCKLKNGIITTIHKHRNKYSIEIISTSRNDYPGYFSYGDLYEYLLNRIEIDHDRIITSRNDYVGYFAKLYYGDSYEHFLISKLAYLTPPRTYPPLAGAENSLQINDERMQDSYVELGASTMLSLKIDNLYENSFRREHLKVEWLKSKQGASKINKSDIEQTLNVKPMGLDDYAYLPMIKCIYYIYIKFFEKRRIPYLSMITSFDYDNYAPIYPEFENSSSNQSEPNNQNKFKLARNITTSMTDDNTNTADNKRNRRSIETITWEKYDCGYFAKLHYGDSYEHFLISKLAYLTPPRTYPPLAGAENSLQINDERMQDRYVELGASTMLSFKIDNLYENYFRREHLKVEWLKNKQGASKIIKSDKEISLYVKPMGLDDLPMITCIYHIYFKIFVKRRIPNLPMITSFDYDNYAPNYPEFEYSSSNQSEPNNKNKFKLARNITTSMTDDNTNTADNKRNIRSIEITTWEKYDCGYFAKLYYGDSYEHFLISKLACLVFLYNSI